MLDINDENAGRKKKQQYQSWNDDVYGALQNGIKSHLNSTVRHSLPSSSPPSPPGCNWQGDFWLFFFFFYRLQDRKALNQRKREEYQQFLDAMNQKGAIFRDIIIESDYDPLKANKNGIKFQTSRIEDPTKCVIQKGEEEAKMIHPGGSDTTKPLCRDTFNVTQWATGKVEASPHGHFSVMFRSNGPTQQHSTQKSSVVFDQYNYPVGREAVDRELPKGKRMNWSEWIWLMSSSRQQFVSINHTGWYFPC